jgi:hypothetical protein
LAQTGQLEHRESNKYGENLYYGWSSEPKFDVSAGVPVQAWYDEIKDYNFSRPGFSPKTGHFTQVVWEKSTELGCGKAKSKDNKIFVVCNYNPPGNFEGEYEANVRPKK